MLVYIKDIMKIFFKKKKCKMVLFDKRLTCGLSVCFYLYYVFFTFLFGKVISSCLHFAAVLGWTSSVFYLRRPK